MNGSLNKSDLRRFGLLEWLVEHGGEEIHAYYQGQDSNEQTIWEDSKALESKGVIDQLYRDGGRAMTARLSPGGQDYVSQLRLKRTDLAERRWALRSALLRWLDGEGAHGGAGGGVTWDGFISKPSSNFYGENYSPKEVDTAAGWLHRQGLIGGIEVDEAEGPVRSHLTDAGLACAEAGSDVRAWEREQKTSGDSGSSYQFGNFNGNFQVATGPNSSQTMTVGLSATELATILRGLLEVFHESFDDPDPVELEGGALSALGAGDSEPAKLLLQRVGAVAKSQAAKGGSIAVASFVTWGAQLLEQMIAHTPK